MRPLTISLLFVILSCSGTEECPESPLESLEADQEQCFALFDDCRDGDLVLVTSVYDGDTITLDGGSKVRLLGINSPEQNKDPSTAEGCMAKEAGDYLRSLIDGRQVCLRYPAGGATTDRYGRTLAWVYIDGYNVNSLMISTGHACVFDRFPDPECLDAFLYAEEHASSWELGIWGYCADVHQDPCSFSD